MKGRADPGRRALLRQGVLATTLGALALTLPAAAAAADASLVKPDEAAARALRYAEDASTVKGITAGNNCASCALYQGTGGSATGPCQAFGGRLVKAAGWCSSWAPQI
jgi:hypothetical protein